MSDEYEIGYRKPPRTSRFTPGQSGNPSGRPKGAKCTRTILKETMGEKITITINGERRTMTKLEAAVLQLANNAVRGDLKAQHKVFLMLDETDAVEEARIQSRFDTEADREIMKALQERYSRADQSRI